MNEAEIEAAEKSRRESIAALVEGGSGLEQAIARVTETNRVINSILKRYTLTAERVPTPINQQEKI
jgi:hypothetical protein